MSFWRRLLAADFGFFAEKSDRTFFALAMIGAAFLAPFAVNNFAQGRPWLGAMTTGVVAWFLANGVALYRGRRLMPPGVVFLPILGALAVAMAARSHVGIFWAYPAILLFHFILERRIANAYNASIALMAAPFALEAFGAEVATRVVVTLVLTILFANIFSYLSERQRHKEAEQERELALERDRLALLVHATKAGFSDWDAVANLVTYSDRFKEMLGYPREADTSAWPPFFELMHPQDRPAVQERFRAMLRRKRLPGLQEPGEALDYRLRRADGSYVWVHAESLAQVDYAGPNAGRIRRFITSYQDISKFRAQEEQLRDYSRFQSDVFDSLPIGLAMRDLQGRYMFVNRAWEGFTGARREDVIGRTVHDRAPKHEADAVVAEDRAVLERGAGAAPLLQDFAYRGRRFMLTRTVMTDAGGAPLGVLVASVDVTDRQKMEEALAIEQRRFELVVRAGNVGILDWDGLTRTAYYSPRLKEILGYAPEADTGGWPDYFDRVHPEDRTWVYKRFREHIMDQGEELHATVQYRLRRADGSYVWIEAFGASVRDAQGFATRFIASITDITERRAQEQALVTEQRRLDLVVRAQQVGIVDWDGRTHATYYSPRFKEILGYPPDADTSGWPDYFKALIHPEDRERITARWRGFIFGTGPEGPRGEYYAPEEYRLLRADGSPVWVQVSGVAVRDEKGFVTRWIAATTDITERRAQEEALRQSVRLREEVERMSRHDLKTPLNSVIAMSRLLRESARLPEEDAELLGTIERAGYRILNMVNLSLDLFRMESGTYQFRPQAVDLVEVARRVAIDLESQAASKGIDVQVRADRPVVARGEELLCYSMLANLVKNAIEAAPEESPVAVTLSHQGDWIVASVHNEGAVPEAMRGRFFQKYATAGKSAGLGLGTYSARLMARVQEGDITLHSSELAGTSLLVRLKAGRAAEAAAAAGPDAAADALERAKAALPALRVLVVDDDEFNRLVLRRTLPTPPLDVAMAVNGRAALEAAERDWPDVVLLDLEMPVMDGYQAARALRELESRKRRKRPVLIAISSNDEPAIVERALAAGCDHYLVKPAPRAARWAILSGNVAEAGERAAGAAASGPAAETDAVLADPDLAQAMPGFLESRRAMLEDLGRALAAGDRAGLKRLAHQLAGSFALYGFRWAADRCEEIEAAALRGEAAELGARARAVLAHLGAVEIRYAAGRS